MQFAPRRAVARAGQLVALGVVTALLGGALAASAAVVGRMLDAGTAALVADADPMQRSIVIDAPAPQDGLGAGAADAAIHKALRAGFGAAPVDVARTTASSASSDHGPLALLADPGIAQRAVLQDGAWPAHDGDVAVAAPAAARADLRTGDTLTIDGHAMRVSGVWAPKDATAAAWAGDPSISSGVSETGTGPFLVTAGALSALGDAARARWAVSAHGPVSVEEVPAYRAGIAHVLGVVGDVNDSGAGVRTTGGWDATLARAEGSAAVARGIVAVPTALAIAVGALVLGVLAHALGRRRADEVQLLRARGAATGAVVAETAAVIGVVTVAAALVGAAAGLIVGAGPATALGVAAGAALAAFVLVTTVTSLSSLAAPDSRADVSRRTLAGVAGGLALAAILAGLAAAQLLTTGLLRGGEADVAAAAAPALAIIAAALLAALLAGPAATLAERLVRRIPSLPPVLALRRIARQTAVVVAGVLSIALAAGGIAFAGATAARGDAVVRADVAQVVGADVRGVYDVPQTIDASRGGMAATQLPASLAPQAFAVLGTTLTVGRDSTLLVGLPAAELARATAIGQGRLDGGTPLALPAGPLDVTVVAAPDGGAVLPTVTARVALWFVDRDGAAREQVVGAVPLDQKAHTMHADVRDGESLAAVEARVTDLADRVVVHAEVPGAGGTKTAATIALDGDRRSGRAVTVSDVSEPLPVVVTRALADRLALHPGDAFALGIGTIATPVPARVAAVRDGLPGIGADAGAALDTVGLVGRALQIGGSVPATDQLWIRTAHIPAASLALRGIADRPVEVVTAASIGNAAMIEPVLRLSVWGTLLGALLAAGAFIAVAIGVVAARRAETVPLRAFGFTRRSMRATAAGELGAAGAFALVCGIVAGLLVSAWLAPPLLASVVVGALSSGAAP